MTKKSNTDAPSQLINIKGVIIQITQKDLRMNPGCGAHHINAENFTNSYASSYVHTHELINKIAHLHY